MSAQNPTRIDQVRECLAYIRDNPGDHYPKGWIEDIQREARELGILPPDRARIGRNCVGPPPRWVEYGGDMADVF